MKNDKGVERGGDEQMADQLCGICWLETESPICKCDEKPVEIFQSKAIDEEQLDLFG